MCGIARVCGHLLPELKKEAINILSKQLSHRGPDGRGSYIDDQVGLVHTRLSIIDISECGNQPIYSESKSIVLICNGEIYNYKTLRQELLKKGHIFSSNSDCETIIHLYEECSGDIAQLLRQLTGMLWDSKKQQIYIARDRIGIKPLYYSLKNSLLVFSSEVKPIVTTGLVNKK